MVERRTDSVTQSEFEREAKSVFASGVDEMVAAERRGDKPVKLLGFLEVPAGMAMFGKLAYNALGQMGGDRLQQPVYEGMTSLLGEQLFKLTKKELSSGTVHKTATAAAFATSFALKSGGYILPFVTTMMDEHKDQSAMARKISQSLDELKGNHSGLAYMMVNMADNQVIAAHKAKMSKLYGSKRMAQVSDLVFNAGLNMVSDVKKGMTAWKNVGYSPDEISAGFHLPHTEAPAVEDVLDSNSARMAKMRADRKAKSGDLLNYVWGVAGAGISEVAGLSSKRKEKEILAHPSTLQMIIALEEQVSRNPNVRVQPPGESRDYSLEAYVMKVILSHQKEMADLDSSHSEIRPALREELAELVKPIADAIRKGDISAMSLISLVGEPKKYPLVLNKGRALATADEVEGMLERMVGKKTHLRMVDVDEFLAKHNTKIQNLKEGVAQLEGAARTKLLSLFPDTILEKIGIKENEVKEVREFRASPEYDAMVTNLTVGMAHEEEKDLKHDGMATAQIKQVDKAAIRLREDAAEIKNLKSGFTNPDGIEEPIIDWALNQIQAGSVHRLGTMETRGKELLVADDVAPKERSFASKVKNEGRSFGEEHHEALDELADEFGTDQATGGRHAGRVAGRRERHGHDDHYRD